jgi:hypothetical protein
MIKLINVKFATSDIEPTMIFLPRPAIKVTILEIVTVFPLPGGPLIKTILLLSDFLIA